MLMKRLFRRFRHPSRRDSKRPTQFHRARLRFETLERRDLLAVELGFTPLVGGAIGSYAGVGFQENYVASFEASVNGQPDPTLSDFQSQIQWGDGGSSTGDLVYEGNNGSFADFTVKGSHIYNQSGTNIPITVQITGPGGTSISGSPTNATVTPMPSGIPGTAPPQGSYVQAEDVQLGFTTVVGGTIDSYTGVGFQENPVASFEAKVIGQPDSTLSDFRAQINWGDDNTWTTGELVYEGNNGSFADFTVKGSHVYTQSNQNIPIVVYITGPDGTSVSYSPTNASVTPMPSGIPGTAPPQGSYVQAEDVGLGFTTLVGGAFGSYAGVGFQENPVASFGTQLKGQPDPTLSDFHAQINWGDDNTWSTGDLVYEGNNGSFADFIVKGSHVYTESKQSIPIVVYITGPDGTSISYSQTNASVTPMPSGIPGTVPPQGSYVHAEEVQMEGTALVGGTIDSTVGVGFQENPVASFQALVNGQPDTNPGDFHAQINWGDDNTWTPGDLIYGTSGNFAGFTVMGSHVYEQPIQNIPIVVYITGPDGTSISGNPVNASVQANPNPYLVGNLSMSVWTAGQPNTFNLTAEGGSGGYNSLQASGLPPGLGAALTGNTVTISGTPSQSGTFSNITISVQDSNHDTGSGTYSVTVNPASNLQISPATLPNDPGGQPYTATLTAIGGSGQYTFSLAAGSLPPGVTLISGDEISGTPTATGTFHFTIQASDNSVSGLTGSQSYTVTVQPVAPTTASTEVLGVGQPGFWSSSSTTWTTNSQGFDGGSLTSSTANGSEQSQAAWWFEIPAGVYEIDMTWTAASNLTANLGLDLYDGVGNWIGQIPVNERVTPSDFSYLGANWKRLGSIKLTNNIFHISTWNSATDGAIAIGAIRLRAAPTVDDSDVAGSGKYYPTAQSGTFATSGSWTASSQGAYGGSHTSSSSAGSGSSIATWTMPVTPGSYEVDVTWAAAASLSANAAYNIYDGTTKLGSVSVNQETAPADFTDNGVAWKSLGSFTVTGTKLTVTLANTAADGQVSADAIRLLPSYQPTELAKNGYPGAWTNSEWTTLNAGLFGDSLLSNSPNGSEQSQAAWWFPCQPGTYEVDVTWQPGSTYSQKVGFDVYNALTYISTGVVNERNAPSGVTDQGVVWQSLGVFTMTSNVLHVSIWNSETDGAINVDGVRIVPVSA